ncbi:MAG TPA: NapC/NirT family cytochrome c [Bacteroidota bacterium]|nr:NapC/NirT family cytochrome c [Bacteroidota bacterium]
MKKSKKLFLIVSGAILLLLLAFGGFSYYWEAASPQATCASCHEIESSSNMWAKSGHRALLCKECHGTALSNGFHSLKEKGMMFVHHFTEGEKGEVALSEAQRLEIMDNCRRCHGEEYANWTSGGHSATYAAIFLNEKHNSTEQLNADCLRCHGMFYEGTIKDLVAPLSIKGPWTLNISEKSTEPVIPCFTCHEVHRPGIPAVPANASDPKKIFYERKVNLPKALFYYRYEKTHVETADLPFPAIWDGGRKVEVSDDPVQRICLQCHAPNAFHQAGTGDDRTPRGIHEGLSCLACHDHHSNDSKQSCKNCHPAISNCQLDVTKMNTTFADSKSPHNIHSMRCIDCHPKGIPKPKKSRG